MTISSDKAMGALLDVAEQTLSFRLSAGGVTRVTLSHDTGERMLPELVTAFVDYHAYMDIESEGRFEIRPGELLCVPPGAEHRIRVTSSDGMSCWSHVEFKVFGSVDVFSLLTPPYVVRGDAARRAGEINTELAELSGVAVPALQHIFRRKALGLELLHVISEASELRPQATALLQAGERLAPVLQYIGTELAGDLSRDVLARIAHFSPSRFHNVFSRALGIAPGKYVQTLRMRKAQQLLIRTNLGVEEIASRVGYGDAFHFSRLFKQYSGLSPSHYRRQIGPQAV